MDGSGVSPSPGDVAGRRVELSRIRPPSNAFGRLNPLTQLAVAGTGVVAAFVLPSLAGALIAAAGVLGCGALAGVAARLLRPGGAATVVVATFDALLLAAAGAVPSAVPALATETGLRVGTALGAIGIVAFTVDLPALGLDLERRGLDHRLAFAIVRALGAIPALAARVRQISAAQEARGLRPGRGPLGRLRSGGPIWLPALVSGLARLDERTLALESRAVGHPGRRDLLWAPADPVRERALRWLLVVLAGLAVAARLLGLPD